ncbi:MAG: NYN domain-containing protein [Terrimicrobiaceae bacterium]
MKQRLLIVDGHSMIFRWPELSKMHGRSGAVARAELVKRLTNYQDNSTWTVVVVFDGRAGAASDVSEPDGIHVFYSAAGQTADSLIERLAAKYAPELDVTVATDDNLERTTVSSLGGSAMSILQLLEDMDAADRHMAERIRQLKRH